MSILGNRGNRFLAIGRPQLEVASHFYSGYLLSGKKPKKFEAVRDDHIKVRVKPLWAFYRIGVEQPYHKGIYTAGHYSTLHCTPVYTK